MSDAIRGAQGTPAWFGYWLNGQLDLAATLAGLPVDELAAADLITAERPGELFYVPAGRSGTWYIWDGRCRGPDESDQIAQLVNDYAERAGTALALARQEVLRRSRAAMLAADPEAGNAALEQAAKKAWQPWEATAAYHRKLRATAGRNPLITTLGTRCSVPEAFMADRHPEWLNTDSGTIDLRSGWVKPHDPADMITYCVGQRYTPGARGSGWEALTWHVAGENPVVWRYLIKMLGYSLLGDNREQLIFFLTGPTGSGKSQVLETVLLVLGALAHSSGSALISRNKSERHARVENSLAGKRFVMIDESAERIHIDEGQLKRLTGSGLMSVNRLYRDTETQVPVSWTIWQATNEMPTLTGFDDAIRRRLRMIPCGSTIPAEYRIKGLAQQLAETEGEAILASLVWGAQLYLAEGECCPPEVELATAEYEGEQNTAAAFREECCQDVPESMWNGGPVAVKTSAVWREYVAWCSETRTRMLPKHAFGKAFRDLPGIRFDGNQKRYVGLMLISGYSKDRQDQ